MSCPFNDYPGELSYSDSATNASWEPQYNMSHEYPSPYDIYSSGARLGESASTSGFSESAIFPQSYNYADSPDMMPFDEPLSPSCSVSSSSSSCSDAPITPYRQSPGGMPLPNVGILYTGLDRDASVGGEHCDSAATYAYEGWEEDADATQTYHIAAPESSVRTFMMDTEYDLSDGIRACNDYIAAQQLQYASPTSCVAPDPRNYVTCASSGFPAVTSSAVSPLHAQECPSSYLPPPVSCLSPSLLSCPPPPKLYQPQPRRSIPVISLSAMACGSSDPTVREPSPALSPLELPCPASPNVDVMSSYSGLPSDSLPIATYPPHWCCPQCAHSYSIS
ncbi:hypothetical protein DFH07DRAFT_959614 [Mycena maculata]|uniref:Uncharacterized protein n=1 Tax=Mycena maculata TaxID=230809 RepID=A0AAD7J1D6_9AGAR|nr:hypothetical protein DFH07DRAFT_959614 [Mycena maculata]